MPFERLLIANRGEITCRIARTARRLGIRTIGVYSDADTQALHVHCCDEAIGIGGRTAAESYLNIDALLQAAHRSGAQAIHPGYGFLSENADFAARCEAQRLIFIGPPAEAIRLMGSKAAARTLMAGAGVAITPGYHGDSQEPGRLQQEAERIGYPVLIKATQGGGGRGIRRVDQPQDFLAALASCQREARASFADDRVLIEKYILRPRHIEIQVFADSQGHCLSLFERDCSVQRRHQKVLEEAPAPGMTPEQRAAMGAAAVRAARAVGYVGAGTVEFIAEPGGSYYFMEMNTRLQVEHPVTEMITGLDLVEWQLRVGAGEALPLTQDKLSIRGHAIEARITAEDPDRGFAPAVGHLLHFDTPPASPRVRVDAGVAAGSTITPYYDSMMAKLIVWGENRERALQELRTALAGLHIVGVSNNVDFLSRLIDTPAFANADLDTALIEREHDRLFAPVSVPREVWLIGAVATLLQPPRPATRSPWNARDGWRLGARSHRTVTLYQGTEVKTLSVHYRDHGWQVELDGRLSILAAEGGGSSPLSVTLDGLRCEVTVYEDAGARYVFWRGRTYVLRAADPGSADTPPDALAGGLRAPMPGRILELLATPGAIVSRGTPLLVLEAMKIEQTLLAPRDGTLRAYRVGVGDQVTEGAELVDLDSPTA